MKNNIKIAKNYKPSTNIIYDIGNKNLVESYIPTESSLDLLEFLIEPVLYKNSSSYRSHFLTGAYGKGKSFVVLLVLKLLQDSIEEDDKAILVEKIRKRRPLLASKIENIGIKNNSRLLPVIIKGGFSSLSLALSNALSESLKKEEISDIIFNSNFNKALFYIETWKTNYIEAYNKFNLLLEKEGYNEKTFIIALSNSNEESIIIFKKIYPIITNGIEFEIISEFQIIDDYKKISKEVKRYGYSGIFIVYDEFSKFLESKNNKMSEGDIKLLQDLAEISNSSSLSNQIHLSLISHKVPTSYFSDSKLINEWEAISGRFDIKDVYGTNNQNYEIIESMLKSNINYVKKINEAEKNNVSYEFLKKQVVANNLYSEISFNKVFETCFPIHPVALYILPRISEIVAQNERTLFSFIVSPSSNSLATFIINNKNNERLYIDYIYDYFEPIFRNAPKKSLMFKTYLMVDSVKNNMHLNSLSKKLVKAIALLIILDDEKIPANFDSLLINYSLSKYSKLEIEKANTELQNFGVVREADGSNRYIPFAIDPQIQSQINRNVTLYKKNKTIQTELVKQRFLLYYLPKSYNDKKSLTRYFKAEIITEMDSLDDIKRKYQLQKKRSNGITFIILDNNKEKIKTIINQTAQYKLCFCLVPKVSFDVEKLEKTLFEYALIKDKLLAKNENIADKASVLRFIMNDNFISINKQLSILKYPHSKNVDCYVNGKQYKYNDSKELSLLCSNLYERYLPNTVIFNREDINLEKPSKISIKARNIIVDSLLIKNIKSFSSDRKTSQNYSIFNALKYYSNIIRLNESTHELEYDLSSAKNNFDIPLKYLREKLIDSSKKELPLSLIISKLIDVDGEIGLKKGLVPFFLAIAFSEFGKRITVKKNGKETRINSLLFNSIISNPIDYYVQLNHWGSKEENYLNQLCKIYSVDKYSLNIYDYLLMEMKNSFQLLPLQTRVIKGYFDTDGNIINYSKSIDRFFNSINKSVDNPYSSIMKELPSKIDKNFVLGKELANKIHNNFKYINSLYMDSISNIKIYIMKKLNITSINNNWLINMHSWVDSLTEKEISNLSDSSLSIVKLISETNNEELLFKKLTYLLIGLRFSDWSNDSIKLLNQALEKINKELVLSNTKSNDEINNEIAVINYINDNGEKIEKTIGISHGNSFSRMLSDEILSIIEESNDALSTEEINKILLDIIIKN